MGSIKKIGTKGKRLIKYIVTIIGIVLLILILDNYALYGFGGFIVLILFLVMYKLIKKREMYINSIRVIESMIWGKPLDKDLWNKGELKNTQVKVVWKKKKAGLKK